VGHAKKLALKLTSSLLGDLLLSYGTQQLDPVAGMTLLLIKKLNRPKEIDHARKSAYSG